MRCPRFILRFFSPCLLAAGALWGGVATQEPAITLALEQGNEISTLVGSDYTCSFISLTQSSPINIRIGADAFPVSGYGVTITNVEAGHFWNGHEALSHISDANYYTGVGAVGTFSAHATLVAGIIAGLGPEVEPGKYSYLSIGIAPTATLRSNALATAIGEKGEFSLDDKSLYSAYRDAFEQSTVVNSSWGNDGVAPENDWISVMLDGFSRAYTQTIFVVASGNSGSGANHVSAPARGYNNLSVGASGEPFDFTHTASLSSGGAGDFYNPLTKETVVGVRAQVDIVAPGVNIAGPLYDAASLSMTSYYSIESGTSVAAPQVAAGAALLQSFSLAVEQEGSAGWTETSRDARVIKAVLMASAEHLENWSNGATAQTVSTTLQLSFGTLTQTYENVLLTTQAVDWDQGAGGLDLESALNIYRFATGGWAYGAAEYEGMLSYWKIGELDQNEILRVALSWFTNTQLDTTLTDETLTASEEIDYQMLTESFADLNLELWLMDENNEGIAQLVAASRSRYNAVEYIDYTAQADGYYALRVTHDGMVYGDYTEPEVYGLSWSKIPEPESAAILLCAAVLLLRVRGRASANKRNGATRI